VKNGDIVIKTAVFDVPSEIWRSGLDSFLVSDKVISFKEYGSKR
jgi:hypothetical protein